MKRANLYGVIVYTIIAMALFSTSSYAQSAGDGTYVIQNFTLSDFGDGFDKTRSLVWKPQFSDFVAQAPANNTEATPGNDQVVIQGGNPDPARSGVNYFQDKPEGIKDIIAGSQKFVLGLKAQFTRQGYNWIELRPYRFGTEAEVEQAQKEAAVTADSGRIELNPTVDAAPDLNAESHPFKIPFSGKAMEVSLWVWGGYYAWWVEIYIRDYLGYQYRFPMGDLLYKGWRQKRTEIPSSVIQDKKRLPSFERLEFEMIKLWSFPSEHVDQFYVYFDLLQYNSKISTDVFNGKALAEEVW